MKKFDLITRWGTDKDCYLSLDHYTVDGSLCLRVLNDHDRLICTLTVYLGEVPKNCAYLDVNNCIFAEKLVTELGIGKFFANVLGSGFCIYPLYKFDLDKIKKYTRRL